MWILIHGKQRKWWKILCSKELSKRSDDWAFDGCSIYSNALSTLLVYIIVLPWGKTELDDISQEVVLKRADGFIWIYFFTAMLFVFFLTYILLMLWQGTKMDIWHSCISCWLIVICSLIFFLLNIKTKYQMLHTRHFLYTYRSHCWCESIRLLKEVLFCLLNFLDSYTINPWSNVFFFLLTLIHTIWQGELALYWFHNPLNLSTQ